MATRKAVQVAPPPANLTAAQMRNAIPKLQRRILDLEQFDPASISGHSDARLDALNKKLQDTITEVFGHGTAESIRFSPDGFEVLGYYSTPKQRIIEIVRRNKEKELSNLQTIIDIFNEKIEDGAEDPSLIAKRAFNELNLQSAVSQACSKLFADKHYSEAVEAACKALDSLVKLRSGKHDLSGVALMQQVFSPNKPILKFNDAADENDRNEQTGMMQLFVGAMQAFRNPRAHSLRQDSAENAADYIAFISMLAKSLDRTRTQA